MSAKEISSSIDQVAEKLYLILSKEHEQLSHLVEILKQKQQCIMDRKTKDLTDLLPKIEAEILVLQKLQKQREDILQLELSSVPSDQQPGIAARILNLPAIFKEKCHKISRQVETELLVVHEIGWQNQLLLSRAVQFLQHVLAPLIGAKPQTEQLMIYGNRGKLQTDVSRLSVFQGVG